jgi:hypothetical protein
MEGTLMATADSTLEILPSAMTEKVAENCTLEISEISEIAPHMENQSVGVQTTLPTVKEATQPLKRTKTDLIHLRSLPSHEPATGTGRVAWIWPEIEAALATGKKLREIWAAACADGLEIPYPQFRAYVSRLRNRQSRVSIKNNSSTRSISHGNNRIFKAEKRAVPSSRRGAHRCSPAWRI